MRSSGHDPGIPNDSRRFSDARENRGLRIGDLDGATTERPGHSVLSGVIGSARNYAKHYAKKFFDHLVEAGVASAALAPSEKPTPLVRLRDKCESYLRTQRGLADSTIQNCRLYMRRLLAFRFGEKLGDRVVHVEGKWPALLGQVEGGEGVL